MADHDAAGNRYELRTFSNTETLGTTILTSQGIADMALVKFAPDGTVLWVRQLGTAGNEQGYALAVDKSGTVYLAGLTAAQSGNGGPPRLALGNNLFVTNAYASWYPKLFVARYSSQGTAEWVQQNDPLDKDYPAISALTLDAAGNMCVEGEYENNFTFAGASLPNPAYRYYRFTAGFQASSGAPRFLRHLLEAPQTGFLTTSFVQGLSTGGYYVAVPCFSSFTLQGTTVYRNNNKPFSVLLRYRSDGTVAWARPLQNNKEVVITAILTDAQDNVYAAGYATGLLPLSTGIGTDTIRLGTTTSTRQALLLKYNPAGHLLWGRQLNTCVATATSQHYALAQGANGTVYCTGQFSNIIAANDDCVVSRGLNDVLVTSYTPTGQLRWARKAGGPGDDYGRYVFAMGADELIVIGSMGAECTFGTESVAAPAGTFAARLGSSFRASTDCPVEQIAPFPTPTLDWLYLPELPLPARVEILDVLGRRVSYSPQHQTCRLWLGDLAAGSYTLRLTTAQGCYYTCRVLKL
ncbi:SBBP repeat-containing protein [Hymenobacter endophyticus]